VPSDAPVAFAQLDKNGDGFLEGDELLGLRPRPPRRGEGGPGMRDRARGMAARILKRYDKDGDEKLSAEERPGDWNDLEGADGNGDGRLDRAELEKFFAKRFGGRRGRRGGRFGSLKRLDSDGDGKITKKEWAASKRPLPGTLFQRLDEDKDGVISARELQRAEKRAGGSWRGRAAEALMRRFDRNGDKKIDVKEWLARRELFDKLDADADGFLTTDELSPKGPREGAFDPASSDKASRLLQRHDKDKDGKLSAVEFPDERRFKEMDSDGDGVLTADELREAMDKRQRELEYDVIERYDRNGDGQVSRSEFTGPARVFDRLDRNKDGVVDAKDR
ncbi:MAG: EF-hand domain-containing protein, partial [Planctomycetota bacterium]|nr:EF-hand domain-containing protein [Planctomycetota bacterium]